MKKYIALGLVGIMVTGLLFSYAKASERKTSGTEEVQSSKTQAEYVISQKGLIESVCTATLLNEEVNDDVYIVTDKKEYRLSEAMEVTERSEQSFVYTFDDAVVTLTYNLHEDINFITRTLETKFTEETKLLKVGFSIAKYEETFLYETYTNAAAAVFARNNDCGYCMGFANPYFYLNDAANAIEFAPSVILEANEAFTCDPNFFGTYQLTGEMISPTVGKTQMYKDGYYQTRYRNPSEGISLDFAETKAMNDFVSVYFKTEEQEFRFMSYNFFSNLPMRPSTVEQVEAYKRQIDAFSELGGDTMLLNPLVACEIPDYSYDSYWELIPEGSYAEEIVNYAREKGLDVGFYMGTAVNEAWSNTILNDYADLPTSWKKTNHDGQASTENCIGSDAFVEWYIQVQKNTIEKYNLDVWTWDPGPGNAFFCYNEEHQHLSGEGDYLGFRNAMKVVRELGETFPDLYFFSFHGLKEYGLWGFQYIDQHEAYWEYDLYYMQTKYDDLSPDRSTVDGMRQQSTWNWYFRFLPSSMNHGLSSRMMQANYMNFDGSLEMDSLVDVCGYRYALMSALAVGGSVTMTIVPDDPSKIDGYVEFYQEWISWARDNFEYSSHSIPFGEQTGCGVEGYSKLIDNEGYVFIVNPYATPLEYSFTLNERIGYSQNDGTKKNITMIYPYTEKRGEAGYGDTVSGTIPGYEVLLFRVSSEKDDSLQNEELTPALDRYLANTYVSDDVINTTFVASDEMKNLLKDAEKYVTKETLSIQRRFTQGTGRIVDCFTRPDRVWLWIFSDENLDVKQLKVSMNGVTLTPRYEELYQYEFYSRSGLFCSLPNAVINWGDENEISVEYPGVSSIKPVVYLHYPKPHNEAFPEKAANIEILSQKAPVLDTNVQVLSATLNDDNVMRQKSDNTIKAILNIDSDEVLGVFASVPISIGDTGAALHYDMRLAYQNGVWQTTFNSGTRKQLIVDPSNIRIWVITKEFKESQAYNIDFTWDLIGR